MGVRDNDRFFARGKQGGAIGAELIQCAAFDPNCIALGGIDRQFHLFAKPFFNESALSE